jgi:hypothetical protein
MTKDDICRWIHMAWDFTNQSEENLKQKFQYLEAHYLPYEKFAKLVAKHEREAVLQTIDELMGMESDRHAMFSEGYDHALRHIEDFIRGREKK